MDVDYVVIWINVGFVIKLLIFSLKDLFVLNVHWQDAYSAQIWVHVLFVMKKTGILNQGINASIAIPPKILSSLEVSVRNAKW